MRLVLVGGVTAAVAIGLSVGWVFADPAGVKTTFAIRAGVLFKTTVSPLAVNPKVATWQQTQSGTAPTSPVIEQDTSAGWEDRKVLRDQLATAISHFEAEPCDDGARMVFIGAWTARGRALSAAGLTPEGWLQPYWRTRADNELDSAVDRLIQEDFTTRGELNVAMIKSLPDSMRSARTSNYQPAIASVLVQRCGRSVQEAPTATRGPIGRMGRIH